ncbi:aldo/keto reductase [Nonomuraea sp. NPDC050227]|uniref:aldo/keto reductase n=1 Tax=Nonomuraea sp. NPDC050227 TaxID=3364360 RepID=UPI0037994F77
MTCLTGCDDRRGPRRLGVPPDVGRQNRDARGPVRQPLRRAAGLSVSRLALGTMTLGAETSEPDSHAIMDRAHEHGVDFFDTADVHADGRTEQITGRQFAQGDGRRDRTASTLARLDELFPPPGPTAPNPHQKRTPGDLFFFSV